MAVAGTAASGPVVLDVGVVLAAISPALFAEAFVFLARGLGFGFPVGAVDSALAGGASFSFCCFFL